jgi:hypothetical protein
MKATDNRQEPFVYGSLGGATVSLVPEPLGKAVAPAPVPPDPEAVVRRDYEFALQLNNRQAWEYFLQQHRSGYYANLARVHLDKIAAEEYRAGATGKAETAKARLEGQNSGSAGPENTAGREQQKATGAETEGLPVAALDQSKAAAPPQETLTPIIDPNLLREIRTRLFELNFDPGPFDGPFGEDARRAVREFESLNKLAATGEPTPALLGRLRDAQALGPWGRSSSLRVVISGEWDGARHRDRKQ